MPYSDADFVPLQEATGHGSGGNGATIAVSLPGGTTEGMTVLIQVFVYYSGGAGISGVATGFSSDSGGMYRRSNVAAGETGPWNFTIISAGTAVWAWYVMEVDNLALTDPQDQYVGVVSGTTANGATKSTGTTPAATGSEGIGFAFFYANKAGAGDVQSWSGYTNGFAEVLESSPAGTGLQVAVARKYYSGFTTQETTATFATTAGTAPETRTGILLYRAAGASINAPLTYLTGFEFGTHGGLGNGAALNAAGSPAGISAAIGTFGTGYLVQAGSARNGGYGLRLSASASTASLDFNNYGGTIKLVTGFNIRPISATGVATMALIVTSGTDLELVYDSATGQFGVGWVGGTTSWQTGTTPLNTWAWVEMRVRADSATHHADWWIETGTGDGHQTSPADLTGQAVVSSSRALLGCLTAETFTADYDDLVITRQIAAYPLTPHVVRLLVPETTGATVSGTSSNFSKFTANGTLAAWAGDAGALLDEVPPTVSASSDGVVQTAVAASDYMNFPMTTYTRTSQEIIAGVRALASLWGGTGTGTGTLGFRGYDGTAETTFVAASTSFDPDSLTAISSIYPLWYQGMWNPASKWTQAMLDAAALRVGFSTDATPDMGVSALYLEVAIRSTPVVRQITAGEADEFTVDLRIDPDNSASVSYLIGSTHATRGATFNYSISGTPQTPVYVAASSTQEVVVNAASFGEISDLSLEPDAV